MEAPTTSFSTPVNTTGMGNPSAPNGNECGSGDLFTPSTVEEKPKKKKMKSLKDYIKEKNK